MIVLRCYVTRNFIEVSSYFVMKPGVTAYNVLNGCHRLIVVCRFIEVHPQLSRVDVDDLVSKDCTSHLNGNIVYTRYGFQFRAHSARNTTHLWLGSARCPFQMNQKVAFSKGREQSLIHGGKRHNARDR